MRGMHVHIGSVTVGVDELVAIAVTVTLTSALYVLFSHTKMGLGMQAASQNQRAAVHMGIRVRRMHGATWALAGASAAVAGVLFACKGSIDPTPGSSGSRRSPPPSSGVRLAAGRARGRAARRGHRAARGALRRGRLRAGRPLRGHADRAARAPARAVLAGAGEARMRRYAGLDRGRGGGAPARARQLPPRRSDERRHLGHRRHGAHGAHRTRGTTEPGARRVPRHRLLRERDPDRPARAPVPRRVPRRRTHHRARRCADRVAGAAPARDLPRHRHPRAVDARRGRHRARRAVDGGRGRAQRPGDHHRRRRDRPLRVARALLLALPRGRGGGHRRVSQRDAHAARALVRRAARLRALGASHRDRTGTDQDDRLRALVHRHRVGRGPDGTRVLHLQPRGVHRPSSPSSCC